ncbi:hypothetical protein P3T36_002192 [Kitasatospora sp. MAP12-15]|uniref:zf-HC2 domain-containing protein n=1 Tax=unclassified Kitasatospora TaxID=2633591 RepID=UPI00247508F9|nr:zf-HC2 domain-containing protein [Kitasatospora sp. MAP12-44]MDH6111878.1 hypothetical protein [Kitasatospora sp. MAP12-44]
MTYQAPEPVEAAAGASHPSVDRLADLHEELLAPAEAAAVRAHLAGCQECSDTLTALSELTDLLGADEPPAMPVDVALRLDAALAAEAARATEVTEAAATAGPQPRPAGRAAPAAPPTRTDRHSRPGRPAFRRRARLLLATAGCLAVLGLGAALLESGTAAGPSGSAADRNAAAVTGTAPGGSAQQAESGTLYSADRLPAQVRQLLADQSSGPGKSVPHATSQTQDATPTTQLPACVRSAVGSDAGDSPLAVGHGSYASTPVDVYVFPIAADPSHLDVYLLDAGCALHAGAAPAAVELHQVVPAH